MQSIKTKILAFALAFSMLLGAVPQKVIASEAPSVQNKGVNIPIGKNVEGYQPDTDGYYGYLPMRYETGRLSDGSKDMSTALVPVLVYDKHVFISESEIPEILGLSINSAGNARRIYAYQRSLALSSGTAEAHYFLGYDADGDLFDAVKITLSAEPFLFDEKIWVPLQDIAILFDLDMHAEVIDEEYFVTVYDPTETVMDVLSYLYYNSSRLMTDYTSGNTAFLGATSAAAQISGKMLDGDLTAYAAVILAAFWQDQKAKELLVRELADDLTVDLMVTLPDETVKCADQSAKDASDITSFVVTMIGLGRNAELDIDINSADQALQEAIKKLGSLDLTVNDSSYLNELVDKVDALQAEKTRISGIGDNMGTAVNVASAAVGVLATMITYASVDEISANGIDALKNNKSCMSYSDGVVLDEIFEYADRMRSGMVEYSLSDYVRKNFGSWILDGLTNKCPGFQLIKITSHLEPHLSAGLEATQSYQLSTLCIPLQSDCEKVLKTVLGTYKPGTADQKGFRHMMDAAYIYLKTCYVARNTALTALYRTDEEMEEYLPDLDFLLDKMAILSANYADENNIENLKDKCLKLSEVDDQNLIAKCVKPLYLTVSGKVLKIEDETPVTDAHCEITRDDNEVGYFDVPDTGSYSDICIPLQPDIAIPYVQNYLAAATLTFTSETVQGEDRVVAESKPGSDVQAETAYLGELGFAAASIIGVIDGELYSTTTSNINADAGINALDIPREAGFGIMSFVSYGGKLYFVEKSAGSSGCDFRLCESDRDGGSRRILIEGSDMDSNDYVDWNFPDFVIEDGKISWLVSTPGFQVPDQIITYDLETDDIQVRTYLELDTLGPLTELIFKLRVFDSPSFGASVTAARNQDGSYTFAELYSEGGSVALNLYNVVKIEDEVQLEKSPNSFSSSKLFDVFAYHDGYAYLSAMEGNDGVLYKMDMSSGSLTELGRHVSVGGGDVFFNY